VAVFILELAGLDNALGSSAPAGECGARPARIAIELPGRIRVLSPLASDLLA
jgi:hypothetical protein